MKKLAISLAVLASTTAFADPPKEDGQWRGALAASLALASGNTKSSNFSIGADGVKATKEDKVSVFLTSLYGTNDVGNTTQKTANRTRGGLRYDWNLSDRTFVFGLAELENDKIANLDSRFSLGAGFGYKVIKEKDTAFDIFGGIGYRADKNTVFNLGRSSSVSTNATELLLGEESSHKLSDSSSFRQKLTIYPNLSDSGKNRAQFDAGFVTAIANGINFQVTLSDRYNSDVPKGAKKSDLLLLTGVSMALGSK